MAQKANLIITLKDQASKGIRGIGQSLGSMTKAVVTSKISVVGLTAALGLGVKSFADFESKLVDVGNLFGATKDEIQGFSDGILDITTKLPVASQDLANGLFDVVSAGVEAGEAMGVLESAARLAVAGVTDTATAVDGLTSAMNAYGIAATEVDSVSDKFFAAQKEGKTTIAELSSNIGKVAPIASSAGVSIDELLASIAAMTKQGVKTSEATTQIKAALSSIIKPSAEAKKTAEELGISFNASALRAKGLSGFLKSVTDAAGGNQEKLSKLFGSVEALNGVLALSKGGFSDLNKALISVENSLGSVDDAAQKQLNTLSAQSKILLNNIKKSFIQAFGSDSGIGQSVVKGLKFINAQFSILPQKIDLILLEIKTKLQIFSAVIIGLLKSPFDPQTYTTILNELSSIFLSWFEQLKKTAEIYVAKIKNIFTFKKDSANQMLPELNVDEQVTKTQTLEEKLNEIRAKAAEDRLAIQQELDAALLEQQVMKDEADLAQQVAKNEQEKEIRLAKQEEINEEQAEQDELELQREIEKQEARNERDAEDLEARKKGADSTQDVAAKLGENLITNEKKVSDILGDVLKSQINNEIDTIKLSEIAKATAKAPATAGSSLLWIPLIEAAAAAGKAAINSIQFHEGGVVGGTNAQRTNFNRPLRINERRAILETGERVMTAQTDQQLNILLQKLNNSMSSMGSGSANVSVQVNDREIARASAKYQNTFKKLNRVGSL